MLIVNIQHSIFSTLAPGAYYIPSCTSRRLRFLCKASDCRTIEEGFEDVRLLGIYAAQCHVQTHFTTLAPGAVYPHPIPRESYAV
jgi:hypothetical protein